MFEVVGVFFFTVCAYLHISAKLKLFFLFWTYTINKFPSSILLILKPCINFVPMDNNQPKIQEEQKFQPNMFWEGFYYLTFFVFFCIVLIPYTPKALSFDRYYPLALITYGLVGLICGVIAYKILKNAPSWLKFAVVAVLYIVMIYYLIDNMHHFAIGA